MGTTTYQKIFNQTTFSSNQLVLAVILDVQFNHIESLDGGYDLATFFHYPMIGNIFWDGIETAIIKVQHGWMRRRGKVGFDIEADYHIHP